MCVCVFNCFDNAPVIKVGDVYCVCACVCVCVQVKCSQYWPDQQVALTASYGDLNVTLKKRSTNNPHYTISHFHVTHREVRTG